MSDVHDRMLRPSRVGVENLILVSFLVIAFAFAWAVYDTTKTAFEDRQEREANQTCRTLGNQEVPCPKRESDDRNE